VLFSVYSMTEENKFLCSFFPNLQKQYQNRLMCVEVIVCYISVVSLRHSVDIVLGQGWGLVDSPSLKTCEILKPV